MWRALRAGLRGLVRKKRQESDLDREIRSFLELSAERHEREGMDPDSARRAARVELGSVDAVKDAWRDAGWESLLESLGRDVRFGARLLRRNPLVTSIAVGTIALGIGAGTAIFSIFDAALLRPLPYPASDRIAIIWETSGDLQTGSVSGPDFLDWQRDQKIFDAIGAGAEARMTLTGAGPPRRVDGWAVTSEVFELLGVRPQIGRLFDARDVRLKRRRVVLSDAFWKQELGADPAIAGKTLSMDGESYEIAGVMPPSFRSPGLWVRNPLFFIPVDFTRDGVHASRGEHWLWALGRLKRGVTWEKAQGAMSSLQLALDARYPTTNRNRGARVVPLRKYLGERLRPIMTLLAAAVGFFLAIACANVANLLIAQASRRHREIAVRKAIGAGRGRVVRQLLTESVLLASAGAAAGLALGLALERLILAFAPSGYVPETARASFDLRVFGFALLLALLTGIVFGSAPGWQAWRLDVGAALKQGARSVTARGRGVRRALVAVETGAALVLLVVAGLALRSLSNLMSQDFGFDPKRVLTVSVSLPREPYGTRERSVAFLEQALERVRAVPGVETAGAARRLPLLGGYNGEVWVEGRRPPVGEAGPNVEATVVSEGFLEALRAPIVRGRSIVAADRDRTVAVVNETMARHYWPDGNALGGRFTWDWAEKNPQWWEIVGVVRDIRQFGLSAPVIPQAYHPPGREDDEREMQIAIRFRPSAPPIAAIEDAIRGGDRNVALHGIASMDEVLSRSASRSRFDGMLLALLAILSLFLSVAGIYGVMSSLVGQSTHEIGIRMALGATARRLLSEVLRDALAASLAGIAGGIVVALALTRLLSRLVFGVGAHDPMTFSAVAAILVGVTLLASWIPARRASRVDPVTALRDE